MVEDLLAFSIIVPTHARPGPLAACLKALSRLDYPHDRFEVLVVDDGSPTPLAGILAPFRDCLDVTLVSQPRAGPAAARNAGAAQARARFLAFTDDDCVPARDWLRALAARFRAAPDDAVGGRTLNARADNSYAVASQFLLDHLFVYYNEDPERAQFLISNNLALPADRFREVGGFDTRFFRPGGEDRDLCDRWLHHGYRMIYAPEVVVYHAQALTFASFWRQHFSYGGGAFRFHRGRAQRGSGPFGVDIRFYWELLRYPFGRVRGVQALVPAALLAVSQVANAAGFAREMWMGRSGSSG